MRILRPAVIAFLISLPAAGQSALHGEQEAIKARISELSSTMRPGGSGGDGYAAILAPGFSRWTLGSRKINDRAAWIGAVSDWFDSGWRVVDGESELVELDIRGDLALTRRVVQETFEGPDGARERYESGVIEVWTRHPDKGWLLLKSSVATRPLETD